jgi:hypothetical protein
MLRALPMTWPPWHPEAGTYAEPMDPRTRRAVTLGVLISLTVLVVVAAFWR